MAHNESLLDPAQSRRVALQLREATRRPGARFGSDLRLAYGLARALLRHESAQRGFRMAATQDAHFTEVRDTGHGTAGTHRGTGGRLHAKAACWEVPTPCHDAPGCMGWCGRPDAG